MAKPKITFEALDDQNGVSRYLISKKRGKLTLDEVQDTCREHLGVGFHCVWQWRIREEGGNGNWYEEDEGNEIRGNDTPTEVEWTEEVDCSSWNGTVFTSHYATCPTCKNWPLYGENPCPYCGQALIVKYPEGVRTQRDAHKMEYVGAHSDGKGRLVCDECGEDEFEFIVHMDCDDAYGSNYKCCKCGKRIESRTKRETEGMYIF